MCLLYEDSISKTRLSRTLISTEIIDDRELKVESIYRVMHARRMEIEEGR